MGIMLDPSPIVRRIGCARTAFCDCHFASGILVGFGGRCFFRARQADT
jgi:hypothetical protein